MTQRLSRSTWLPGRPADVFPFFADAGNLVRITPPELPIEMRVGALIDYRLTLFGVPFGWRTRISRWDPPNSFCDEQIRGPYAEWVHEHEFIEDKGGTRMEDRVQYALPLGPLGGIALPLVRRELARIFDYRRDVIGQLLGTKPA